MYAKHHQKTLMDFAITAKICTLGYNCTLIKKLCTQIMADYSISIIYDRRGVASKEKNRSVEICVYSMILVNYNKTTG